MSRTETTEHRPVLAIGLDSAEPRLLDRWIDEGHLPNLARLRTESVHGRTGTTQSHITESAWGTFISGAEPAKSGLWGAYRFDPESYSTRYIPAGTPEDLPPFYALGPDRRVAIFDLPKSSIHPDVGGLQIIGWGAAAPDALGASEPEEFLEEMLRTYGPYPGNDIDEGDWWNVKFLRKVHDMIPRAAHRRAEIVRDLLRRERWDLFLTVFAEMHIAGHAFWHLNDHGHPLEHDVPHPFGEVYPMLQAYTEVDAALGRILEAAPADSVKIVFSIHGMDANVDDLPSFFFLGEFLYRLNFPGRCMFAKGERGAPPPPPIVRPRRNNWTSAIWCEREDSVSWRRWIRRHAPNRWNPQLNRWLGMDHSPELLSPFELQRMNDPTFWQPVSWYKRFWPAMKAFALPSFTSQIRINLAGREASGIVQPDDYETTCDWLEHELRLLVNARTGKPLVKNIVRMRRDSPRPEYLQADGDLAIEWTDEPADVVESPTVGRIGPVPFKRTGSHRTEGFYFISGPGIEPGHGPRAELLDLPPTILSLMGEPVPSRLAGKPLVPAPV